MRITKVLTTIAIASITVPMSCFVLGMLLQRIVPGCGGDEGSGYHGCKVLSLDLSWLVGNLVLGGFVATLFCVITVFPASIVLGLIAAFFESAEAPERIVPGERSNIVGNPDLEKDPSEGHNKQNNSVLTESVTPIKSSPILEATDVHKFIVTASNNQIRLAHADQILVSRFFNAIRYGLTTVVREAVSASPLLVLAKDTYGNSPVEVAMLEKNSELVDFFKACLETE